MSKPTDIQIIESFTKTEHYPYRSPMKFGGRVVRDVVLLHVAVRVRTRNGHESFGYGSMPMGNIWAWPSHEYSPQQTLQAMIDMGESLAQSGADQNATGHPLELLHDFSTEYATFATQAGEKIGISAPVPLAQRVAASPFEAAVFDAYGRVHGENSYNLLSSDFCNRDLSHYLGDEFVGEYLDRYTLRSPKPTMPLYHLVGALDPLDSSDVESPQQDGLPEHLGEWILHNGLTHLKIKLNGDDLRWDVERVGRIDRLVAPIQQNRGVERWFYSVDFNERCPDVEYVLDFFRLLEEGSPGAFQRIQYIEQPTSRVFDFSSRFRMERAAAIKPVVADESLVDFESLRQCRTIGYSGVALKACKGETEALLAGAAAQKYGMFLSVQDLTCPGASFLHSATLSARIPSVAAIEGNGRQYCPQANSAWEGLYPDLFFVSQGVLGTGVLNESGLGFTWPKSEQEKILPSPARHVLLDLPKRTESISTGIILEEGLHQ